MATSLRGQNNPLMKWTRILVLLAANIPRLHSYPTSSDNVGRIERRIHHEGLVQFVHGSGEGIENLNFALNLLIAFILVVLGGVFAGLTLGLMGQDEIHLQVIEQSGEGTEKQHATKVLSLLKRGKHWVLVTLLLSNVITNETLPIVLDKSLGGGWQAVLASTALIVIFGEIIPQSVCVRYGLTIGAFLSPFVLGLMYVMYPVAYPVALLLDWILGKDHGTIYKKAGLKTLVTLHKTLGSSPSECLNQDEVTIISAVLDLKDKPVGSIMTPIKDVFTMSSDTVLDEKTMDGILSAGYSRIPIHAPGEPTNFVGMLLVKILITYDPEDEKKVGEFPLATLPETKAETSCLDIVNFFQEGKSHMVVVSLSPGENHGALGVVTLEDVIEELIGEEIIDESDVFIDVHKAIRRINPPPLSRRSLPSHFLPRATDTAVDSSIAVTYPHHGSRADGTFNAPTIPGMSMGAIPEDMMQHLKHLGPANLAGNPKRTKSKTVKIKPGTGELFREASASGHAAVAVNAEKGPKNDNPNRPDSESNSSAASSTGLEMGQKTVAKSGVLIERVEEVGGISKTVIETTSSEEEEEDQDDQGEKKKWSDRNPFGSRGS
ncbi:cell agglutination protein Mam3 [Rhizina undulata]